MSHSETTFRSILFVFSSSVSLPRQRRRRRRRRKKNRPAKKSPNNSSSSSSSSLGKKERPLSLSLSLSLSCFFMLNFDVLSPLRFKLLHDFQKLVVRLFPIFQAIFQVSQVTQRVLFSRGVVDCPACCDRLVTREREPWLLSVAKEGRERTRFKWSVVWCLWYRTKRTRGARAMRMCKFFPNQSARFLGFRRTLFFSNLKYIRKE